MAALWADIRPRAKSHGAAVQALADALGVTPRAIRYRLQKHELVPQGPPRRLPGRGVKRYLFTSASSGPAVNDTAWTALHRLRRHYDAELHVARYTYGRWRDNATWDPATDACASEREFHVAPDLVWCPRLCSLPTAVRPLSGLQGYPEQSSAIFPHPKVAVESVATLEGRRPRIQYTTGTVTDADWRHSKAALKADRFHTLGALLVEVNAAGDWWARHVCVDEEGRIQDLDAVANQEGVTTGHRVEAITWGDFHAAQMPAELRALLGPILDDLRPAYQYVHDLLDFQSRNHHHAADPHMRFGLHHRGLECVEKEVAGAAGLLGEVERPWCQTVVVDSNHDRAYERWLREADYRKDPVNALFFLESQLAMYRAVAEGRTSCEIAHRERFHLLEWALRRAGCPEGVLFLRRGESHQVGDTGIEGGIHGDDGINGAKGSPRGLAATGIAATTAHAHTAGWVDNLMTVGAWFTLNPGYAHGPSSWSHTLGITYPNGRRALGTLRAGKIRA